jgi:hypothetical protein
VCGEDVAALFRQTRKDFRHMRGRFLLAKNYFRHSGAQGPVMIDFGEAQVFKRHVAQALHGIVRRELALADCFEQFADGVSVHKGTEIEVSMKTALGIERGKNKR